MRNVPLLITGIVGLGLMAYGDTVWAHTMGVTVFAVWMGYVSASV